MVMEVSSWAGPGAMLCRLLTNRVDIFPSSFLTNRVDIFPSSFLTNRVDPLCRGQGSDGSRGIGRQRGRGLFTMPEYTPHWLQWRKGESLSAIRGAKVFAYKDPERPGGPRSFGNSVSSRSRWVCQLRHTSASGTGKVGDLLHMSYRGPSRRVGALRQTGDRPRERAST